MRRIILMSMAVAGLCAAAQSERKQVSDLPTLYIDMANPSATINKETYEDCELEFVGAGSDTVFADGRVRGRGNSTWVHGNKKPYKLKFGSKHRLLGSDRANAKKWVLMANNFDKTLIRNNIASYIATELGQAFAPGSRFVDLVLNGRFMGNYQITDQIDIRKKRVNIVEQELPADENSNITGGYLIECLNEGWTSNTFRTDMGSMMEIKSPDEDVTNDAQRQYIRGHMNKFEARLFGTNFTHPTKGYRQYVDSLSLASWYLTNELTINPDAFWSSFIYKEADDDRIFFGPVWDFDIAFNNCARLGDTTDDLMVEVGFHCYSNVGTWISRMRQDPWFNNLLGRQWREAVEGGLQDRIMARIDSLAGLLEQSQELNYQIYNIDQRYWDEMELFSTYGEGIDFLKNSISDRFAFMNYTFVADDTEVNPDPDPDPDPTPDPDPQPGQEPMFIIPKQEGGGYHIYNIGAMMPVAPNEEKIPVIRAVSNPDSDEFIWDLHPDGNYFRIVNRASGLAVANRSGYPFGETLQLVKENASSTRQLWEIKPLYNTANACVVVNVESNLAWNNNGGFADDGNTVISWSNDANNALKTTRQWGFALIDEPEPEEPDEPEQDGINEVEEPDYRVTYSPSARCLRFVTIGSAAGSISGEMSLYNLAGQNVLSCAIEPEVSVAALPAGTYILRWQTGRRPRTLKIRL